VPDPDADEQRRAAKRHAMSKKLAIIIAPPGVTQQDGPDRDGSDYINYDFAEPVTSGATGHGTTSAKTDFPPPARMALDSDTVSRVAPTNPITTPRYEDPRYIDRRRPR
jgi:hypothetical protein